MGHANREPQGREKELIEAVEEIGSALPEVSRQRDGFGHTTFKVRKKTFVMIGDGYGRGSLSIKADHTTQDLLVQRGPWQRTPYIGQHGWVTVWGDDPIDWEEVGELVKDAYRTVAPKRLLREMREE
jgi:predicted DNA-binding protein (MmcQ/YjbR family)